MTILRSYDPKEGNACWEGLVKQRRLTKKRIKGNIFFKEIQDNLWLFEFSDEEDLRRVLKGHPWSYDHTLLVLNEFDGKTPPSQMDFSFTPIWIQIHDMPLACMNRGVGRKIGESIGTVEEVAIAEDDVGWGRSLRIRVAINLYQPLDRGRALLLTGKSCWVPFKYVKLPTFCYKCGRIFHGPKGCSMRISTQQSHTKGAPEWGSWLRADDVSWGPDLNERKKGSKPLPPEGMFQEGSVVKELAMKYQGMKSDLPAAEDGPLCGHSAEASNGGEGDGERRRGGGTDRNPKPPKPNLATEQRSQESIKDKNLLVLKRAITSMMQGKNCR